MTVRENFCCACISTQTCWARLCVPAISTLQGRGKNSQVASLAKIMRFRFCERPCLQIIRWGAIKDPQCPALTSSLHSLPPTPYPWVPLCFPVSSPLPTLPYPDIELIWLSTFDILSVVSISSPLQLFRVSELLTRLHFGQSVLPGNWYAIRTHLFCLCFAVAIPLSKFQVGRAPISLNIWSCAPCMVI